MKEDLNQEEYVAKTLFAEATELVRKAAISKDMQEVSLAQAMIEGVNVSQKEVGKMAQQTQTLQKRVDKRKAKIISQISAKKPKAL